MPEEITAAGTPPAPSEGPVVPLSQEGGVAVPVPAVDESNARFSFKQPSLFTAGELRKLRMRHEDFTRSLTTRLSIFFRLDFTVQLASLETRLYPKFTEAMPNPTHVALFKIGGLAGTGLLELPPRFGVALVDRLCGGSGKPGEAQRELSEIEAALVERIVHPVVKEWCQAVLALPDAQPEAAGHETNPRFLQTSTADAPVLVVALDVRMGEAAEKIQLGIPFDLLEPVLGQLRPAQKPQTAPVAPSSVPPRWNAQLNDVNVPLTAAWDGLEISARQLAALKAGDVLPVDPALAARTRVRLAQRPKFTGRLGDCAGTRAVELTEPFKP